MLSHHNSRVQYSFTTLGFIIILQPASYDLAKLMTIWQKSEATETPQSTNWAQNTKPHHPLPKSLFRPSKAARYQKVPRHQKHINHSTNHNHDHNYYLPPFRGFLKHWLAKRTPLPKKFSHHSNKFCQVILGKGNWPLLTKPFCGSVNCWDDLESQ